MKLFLTVLCLAKGIDGSIRGAEELDKMRHLQARHDTYYYSFTSEAEKAKKNKDTDTMSEFSPRENPILALLASQLNSELPAPPSAAPHEFVDDQHLRATGNGMDGKTVGSRSSKGSESYHTSDSITSMSISPSRAPSSASSETEQKKKDSKSSSRGKRASKGLTRSNSSKSGSSSNSGKGKGKGKGGNSNEILHDGCRSAVAQAILDELPEIVTRNPAECCAEVGPVAIYVTHATPDVSTKSGYDVFWDEMYTEIAATSRNSNVCFVFTGIDLSANPDRSVDEVLLDSYQHISQLPAVISMMVTDPTLSADLANEVRLISENPAAPSIGVFNSGYNNIVVESVVAGKDRLPYIGHLSTAEYGAAAGEISLELLQDSLAVPLCFSSGAGDADVPDDRCSAYYFAVTGNTTGLPAGQRCDSSPTELVEFIRNSNANVLWSDADCCSVVANATDVVRSYEQREIVVGCQDRDTTNGLIEFVTKQSIALQAYTASSWANYPVIQAQNGKEGRSSQFFPSLPTLVYTAITNQVIL